MRFSVNVQKLFVIKPRLSAQRLCVPHFMQTERKKQPVFKNLYTFGYMQAGVESETEQKR